MKLVSYQSGDNQIHLGAILGDQVINLHQASGGSLPDDMLEFLKSGEIAMQAAIEVLAKNHDSLATESVNLLAPVLNPSKVIAIDLGLSPRTVEAHRAHIMEKMQTKSLADLVRTVVVLDALGQMLQNR